MLSQRMNTALDNLDFQDVIACLRQDTSLAITAATMDGRSVAQLAAHRGHVATLQALADINDASLCARGETCPVHPVILAAVARHYDAFHLITEHMHSGPETLSQALVAAFQLTTYSRLYYCHVHVIRLLVRYGVAVQLIFHHYMNEVKRADFSLNCDFMPVLGYVISLGGSITKYFEDLGEEPSQEELENMAAAFYACRSTIDEETCPKQRGQDTFDWMLPARLLAGPAIIEVIDDDDEEENDEESDEESDEEDE